MKFKNQKLTLRKPSKKRLTLGVFLGLFYAFAFYSLMFLFRETMRLTQYILNMDTVLSENHAVSVNNLFIAFIAVILGQSVCFDFWYSRPNNIFQRQKKSFTRVLNYSRVLHWSFLSWSAKLATLIPLIAPLYHFNIANSFFYQALCVLIIITLWMQSWFVIKAAYGNQKKWLLYSGLIVFILSFSLSKIQLIEKQTVNKIILKENIAYGYSIAFSKVSFFQKLDQKHPIETINIALKDTISTAPVFIINNQEVSFNKLFSKMRRPTSSYGQQPIYKINVDKHIKMDVIMQFEENCAARGVRRLSYTVLSEKNWGPPLLRKNTVLNVSTPWVSPDFYKKAKYPPPPSPLNYRDSVDLVPFLADFRSSKKVINISTDNHHIQINNEIVELQDIANRLKTMYDPNQKLHFDFYLSNKMTFSEYIQIYAQIKLMIYDVKNEYAQQQFGKSYDSLFGDEQRQVWETVNISLATVSPDMAKYLNF